MSTLRRYQRMKPSSGTRIPEAMRRRVVARDRGCVGFARLPGDCAGPLELDHVRASHGMGMKSRTEPDNLVALCGVHHRYKTSHGREARPILLGYLEAVAPLDDDCGHVDPSPSCDGPCQGRVPA